MTGAKNLDAVRRTNLGRVLRTLHREGAHSRAQLTRLTGLNRSTIAALVAELEEHGVVRERAPEDSGVVGRPSPMVAVAERVLALSVHVEIDSIEVAAVGMGGVVQDRLRVATAQPAEVGAVADQIVDLLGRLRSALPADSLVAGVGVAVPGLVRVEDGAVRLAPGLGWRDEPLGELLSARIELPVWVENDASLAARAERDFGAGRGINDLVYLNGGASGIGGGIVLGGVPIRGAGGYAGEFGHALGPSRGEVLERAVTREAVRIAAGAGSDATDREVLEAVLCAPERHRVIVEQAEILGEALGAIANMVNPSRIVLGGFLAILLEVAGAEVRAACATRALAPIDEGCDIRAAELAGNRLLIGAAEPVFDALCTDPVGMVSVSQR